jgi:hypothetical protein
MGPLIVSQNSEFLPIIFNPKVENDLLALNKLKVTNPNLIIHNEINSQIVDLIKCNNPSINFKVTKIEAYFDAILNGNSIDDFGVWVYYPWNNNLIHLLSEDDFITVRTNRNQLKITKAEQKLLSEKKIGVIGLSVGNSIALTMAMERVCGYLRLVDYDELELSNLNRIRTGLHNLGLPKAIITAREISEIDPFIRIEIFKEGLHEGNMNNFFTNNGNLDLVVEVCDSLDLKIQCRVLAKKLGIPVLMDTNDRGMLDIERFDLDPNRPILHGLANGLDPSKLKELSKEDKIPYVLKIVGAETITARMKASMLEVEQSIYTWPQLASSVMLGGAVTTDVCRRILLNQFQESGRYYIDFDELVGNKNKSSSFSSVVHNPFSPLGFNLIKEKLKLFFEINNKCSSSPIPEALLNKLIDAVIAAPSAGNNQPWKWAFKQNVLFLFHDKSCSWSWGDHFEMGAKMSLGSALENLYLQAIALGIDVEIDLFPEKEQIPELIAAIYFCDLKYEVPDLDLELSKYIFLRCTNRKLGGNIKLSPNLLEKLEEIAVKSGFVNIYYTESEEDFSILGEILSECDKIRLLNQQGHAEFYKEIRWNKEIAEKTGDGIEINAADLSQSELAGFTLGQDWNAISFLSDLNAANGLKRMSIKTMQSASGMLLVTIPSFSTESLINVGRIIERMWLWMTKEGVSMHPMLSPIFFLNKLYHDDTIGLSLENIERLKDLGLKFKSVFNLSNTSSINQELVFLMKLSKAENTLPKSYRKEKSEVFENFK